MALLDLYFMSPPPPDWSLRGRANFRSAAAPPLDPVRALAEWVALADGIEARGGRVVCVSQNPGASLSGLPFAAEAGHAVEHQGEWLFLLPSMRPVHRRAERDLWAAVALEMGLRPVDPLAALKADGGPADFWEGQGDVAVFRGVPLLFYGGRTTLAGARAASVYFREPMLVEIREPAFHGNMAALPLDPVGKMLIGASAIAPQSLQALRHRFGDAVVEVAESEVREYATNSLLIERALLAPHLLPSGTRRLVESWGLEVIPLTMDELCAKGGGASRCLVSSARVPGALARVPPRLDYRLLRRGLIAGPAVV